MFVLSSEDKIALNEAVSVHKAAPKYLDKDVRTKKDCGSSCSGHCGSTCQAACKSTCSALF